MNYLVFLFILLFYVNVSALDISSNTSNQDILQSSSMYIDKTNSLSFEEIKNTSFSKINTNVLGFGFVPNTAVWVKITLKNTTNKKLIKILEYDNVEVEDVFFYDGLTLTKEGMFHIPKERTTLNPIFTLELNAFEEKVYYIKAHSRISSLIVKLMLWEKEDLVEHNYEHHLYLTIFFSVMISLLLYNIVLFIFTSKSIYIYYTLYLFSVIFFQSIYLGYVQLYILSNALSILLTEASTIVVSILVIPIILFSRQFLQTKNFKKLDAILKFYIYITPLLCIISFDNFLVTSDIVVVFVPLIFIISYASLYALYKGMKEALLYSIGWIFLVISLIFPLIRSLGLFDITIYFAYLNEVAFIVEAQLFSIALAYRIKLLSKEKELADKEILQLKDEEKQELNLLVSKKTQDLNDKNIKLSLEIQNKNILSQEVYHRVKNNLQIISSLFSLQSMKTQDLEVKEILKEMNQRIQAMSLIHEKLYKSNNLEALDMKVYIQDLVSSFNQGFHIENLIFKINCENIHLSLESAIPIGLIINELITNAIKYAFTQNQSEKIITINIHTKKNDSFCLEVSDNGCGMDLKVVKQGFGYKLLDTLVSYQLKGKLSYYNDNGVHYEILFSKGLLR